MHVPEFKAGRDWRVALHWRSAFSTSGTRAWHEGVLNPMRY
jgi:hypothetical protein